MPVNSISLPPGAELGNLKILHVLGQGGFGISYLAYDKQLERNVVLKECFPASICRRDEESGEVKPLSEKYADAYFCALDAMQSEARTLANMNHEHVVRVYDVFRSAGSIFCVMPFLPGGSLADKMKDRAEGGGVFCKPEDIQLWLRQLLDALQYIHGKGVIHRDIKPENILFDEKGQPVLIDFGAARNRASQTQGVTTQGAFSYAYAAPEQLTGKGKIGAWTDHYALAAVWRELITGERAEAADRRLVEDSVMPLKARDFGNAYPQSLLDSLHANLALDPALRSQSSAEWLAWLGGDVSSRPSSARHKKPLLQFSLAALLLAAGAGAFVFMQQEEEKEPPAAAPKPAAVSYDDLLQEVRAACKVDETKQAIGELHERNVEKAAEFAEKGRELLESAQSAFAQAANRDEGLRIATSMMNDVNKLVSEASEAQSSAMRSWSALFHRPELQESEILHYPADSVEAQAMLPGIASDLRNEMNRDCLDDMAHPPIQKFIDKFMKEASKVQDDLVDKALRLP